MMPVVPTGMTKAPVEAMSSESYVASFHLYLKLVLKQR